ncbi:MAG: ANTAR domain-containing protein [Betaproteobacteria bacterium]|nr:MAG: ANTAR domain-containing protein [Betaproteobacteria bacterium]
MNRQRGLGCVCSACCLSAVVPDRSNSGTQCGQFAAGRREGRASHKVFARPDVRQRYFTARDSNRASGAPDEQAAEPRAPRPGRLCMDRSEDEAPPSRIAALRDHRVIGMAVGVLMERHRLSAELAFDALRRQARSERIKLVQLASAIVAGTAQLRSGSPPP